MDELFFTLINNIDDEQGEEDDMEFLFSDVSTFFISRIQKNFTEAKFLTHVFSSDQQEVDRVLNQDELGKLVGGETNLNGAFELKKKRKPRKKENKNEANPQEIIIEESKDKADGNLEKKNADDGIKPEDEDEDGEEEDEPKEEEVPEGSTFAFQEYCYKLASKKKVT